MGQCIKGSVKRLIRDRCIKLVWAVKHLLSAARRWQRYIHRLGDFDIQDVHVIRRRFPISIGRDDPLGRRYREHLFVPSNISGIRAPRCLRKLTFYFQKKTCSLC